MYSDILSADIFCADIFCADIFSADIVTPFRYWLLEMRKVHVRDDKIV